MSGRAALKVTLDRVRLSLYDANGFLGYQIDALGEQNSGAPDVEALHPFGFSSRAPDPEVDGNGDVRFGATALTIWEGSECYVIALSDARTIPILASQKKGESIQYGIAGNFVRCHLDGRVSRMSTTDGTPNGQTVFDEIGPTGYLCKTPFSKFRNDASGLHYEGPGGGRLDIGFIGGLPAPFSAFSSYAELQAHTVRVKASAIQLGDSGVGARPVARATPELVTALQQIALSLTALGGVGVNQPALAAIQAAVLAIGTALPTLPSSSTTAT